jgi:MEMO1 family protein
MATFIRHPAVAGRFYPDDPDDLRQELKSYISPSTRNVSALGCIVPHAGYMYSGHVAGAVFGRLNIPSRCIVLCPNHTGRGEPLSIVGTGEWETPLGRVPIDSTLATALKEKLSLLSENLEAHRVEHAIEVEIPFLQMLKSQFSFVPIVLGTGHFEILEALGKAIAEVLLKQSQPVLIVASSDMNHYEDDHTTRIKDRMAIDQILALNPRGLFDIVTKERISMCGFGPAVVMLTAARGLGASRTELVKYATSGDVSGDRDMVVGYAGVIVN